MTNFHKQYLTLRRDLEASLISARNLRDQWLVASCENPTNLAKKDVDYLGKALKNKLLTLKWDCEDLEELISEGESGNSVDADELFEAKNFIEDSRAELSRLMNQMEQVEKNSELYTKHGISPFQSSNSQQTSPTNNYQSKTTNISRLDHQNVPTSKYDILSKNEPEEIQFDKNQVALIGGLNSSNNSNGGSGSVSESIIFNNDLYDHFEQNEERLKGFCNSSQVFNNLSRPVTNVYVNPNENEMILDMLETEYYNPPSGLQTRPNFSHAIRKLLQTDRNRFFGTIAFLFSFPIILFIFLLV